MPASAYACRDVELGQQDSAAAVVAEPMIDQASDGDDGGPAPVASLGDALAIAEDIRPCLVRRVHRMLGDWGTAEDAVQDAIILLCARWQRLGNDRTVRAWLSQTVRRKALEMRRRRRLRSLSACAEPASRPGSAQDPRLDIIADILGRIRPRAA